MIPYNKGQSVLEVTEKFMRRDNIPSYHKEEIMGFIKRNIKQD
jgi:hypothetical protein